MLFLIILLFTCLLKLNAQQVYRFQYRFHPTDFKNNKLQLFEKKEDKYERRYFGFLLKGEIGSRNKDTFTVNLWPPLALKGNNLVLDSNGTAHDSDYIIVVKDWNPNNTKFKKIKIRFREWELTATNLPFRVKFRDSTNLEGEFLSFNVTFLRVFGTTKIFQSRFVKPRNRSIAIGPYAGLSKIENPNNNKSEFALNYGANVVYSLGKLNLVLAAGAENGFKKGTKKLNPYIGFGIGFSLVDKFEPEIESKE
jgi:hypothetical protein